mmetsp:Transcript_18798/g.38176  ORF Transcript_18798/g.38176 Transcript_18798/m.38176 type:complete len:364 (+) Transcript_18798:92-1183(+)
MRRQNQSYFSSSASQAQASFNQLSIAAKRDCIRECGAFALLDDQETKEPSLDGSEPEFDDGFFLNGTDSCSTDWAPSDNECTRTNSDPMGFINWNAIPPNKEETVTPLTSKVSCAQAIYGIKVEPQQEVPRPPEPKRGKNVGNTSAQCRSVRKRKGTPKTPTKIEYSSPAGQDTNNFRISSLSTTIKKASGVHNRKPGASKRGEFVKNQPKMWERAREGQKRWIQVRNELRLLFEEKGIHGTHDAFSGQLAFCAEKHVKPQRECVLRVLQYATFQGFIRPFRFSNEDGKNTLGWTGFSVFRDKAEGFKNMFQKYFLCKPASMNNAMRKFGLGPGPRPNWEAAWKGIDSYAFYFKMPAKRALNF